MTNVLFVCLGNICRSPLAQALMEKKIKEKGLTSEIHVDSCGTSQYHIGESPDKRTLQNAADNGLKIEHKARQFSKKDFRDFDYIVAMDSANLECVRRMDQTNEFDHKLLIMRDYDEVNPGADVPDPYFGGSEGFQHVYQMLDRSVEAFLEKIIQEKNLHELKS